MHTLYKIDTESLETLKQLALLDNPEGVQEVTACCPDCGNSVQVSATLAVEIVEGRVPGPWCPHPTIKKTRIDQN